MRGCPTVKWVYQARRVATQNNAGGGAMVIDVSIPTGSTAKLIAATAINSANNGISIATYDEDNNIVSRVSSVAAVASATTHVPSIGTAASASVNLIHSLGLIIAPGQKLTFAQSAAGAASDTVAISIALELYNTSTTPSWSSTRSTNAADVTIAASTISAANTTQMVICND